MSDPVEVKMAISAPAELVFDYFTRPELLAQWIGIGADLEPRPGGLFRFELVPGEFCSGRYVEVERPRRLVFTWGWESGAIPVAPGSTTVEVELQQSGETTIVRLTHRGLPGPLRDMHEEGWLRYLTRLSAVLEGREPGADPATQRDPRIPYEAGRKSEH